MGDFFDALSMGRKQGENNIPVKLIEPSTGRIVKLEVTEENEYAAKMCMNILRTSVVCLEQYGALWSVDGNTIQIVFADENMAESARQTWRK